jgi:hypothetical protein
MARELADLNDSASLIEWINGNWNAGLSENELLDIVEFCLLWNLFEALVVRSPDIGKIAAVVKEQLLLTGLPNFEQESEYFRDRYILTEGGDVKLKELVQKDKSTKRAIVSGLGLDATSESRANALLLICCRMRNNLFHGIKGLWELPKREDLFVRVNAVLKKYIDNLSPDQKSKALPAE